MPAGVPVGTLAIGEAGAANAGLLAAQILALSDHALATRVMAWRAAQTDGVAEAPRIMPDSPASGKHHRHPGRRPARPHAGARRGAAGLKTHIYSDEPDVPGLRRVAVLDRRLLRRRGGAQRLCRKRRRRHLRVRERAGAARSRSRGRRRRVRPPAKALAVAQDRLAEKDFMRGLGIPSPTTPTCMTSRACAMR